MLLGIGFGKVRRDGQISPVNLQGPASVEPGTQTTYTIDLNQPSSGGNLSLSSSNSSQISVPSYVYIPAGDTSVQFSATASSTATTGATLSAYSGNTSVYETVTVQ